MSPAPFPSATSTWHDTSYPSISVARPELSAANKSVLITGGGTGIGAATAHSFAQAGATRIAILGRREKPLLETKAAIEAKYPSVHVFTAPTDVTNKDEVDSAFAKFLQDGKQTLDVLVHSAAIIGPLDPAATVAAPDFLAAVTANLSGALNVLQAFKRYATPGAAVAIDINSGAAHISFGPGFAAYSVSKMAVYRLFDSFGQANVGNGVRVYHLQPGSVDTDMNRQAGGVAAIGVEDHREYTVCLRIDV
jgi:NAD(P)-dependent dehydrogenase (short-subunit alcohol dehydrogenase family)